MKDGMKWFQLAAPYSDDAKVGLGAAYMQLGSLTDLEEAIEVLYVQLFGGNPRYNYSQRRSTGVTNAEVHAMLAYAFAATGDVEKSEEQMAYAKELNPNYSGQTIDQLFKAIEFLNNN